MTDMRRRIVAILAVSIGLTVLGVGYVWAASQRVDRNLAERQDAARAEVLAYEDARANSDEATFGGDESGEFLSPGDVVVVNRIPGDDYGRIAVRHPDGTRTVLSLECERVHVAGGNGICTSNEGGVLPAYRTTFFDATTPLLEKIKRYSTVLPSRARVSPDGSRTTTTGFVSGSSYADIGGEASTIAVIDTFEEANRAVALHQFEVDAPDPSDYRDGHFWGVTFVDDNEFYVTASFGREAELMRGSVSELTLWPTGWIGSCPSLSPDGTTLVYKRPSTDEQGFDLVTLDLDTDESRVLDESRSVDDQVEWLDDDTILYALHPDDAEDVAGAQAEFDIWSLDLAPGSEPELFLPSANSPAAIR